MHLKKKLLVRVIEARNIPALEPYGFSCPYVKLKLGKQKYKTKVVKKSLNPMWSEEFTFRVDDMKEELKLYLMDEDKFCKYDFVGIVKVPVSRVLDGEDQSLGSTWYPLKPENKKSKIKECGEIRLSLCFLQNNSPMEMPPLSTSASAKSAKSLSSLNSLPSSFKFDEIVPLKEEKSQKQSYEGILAPIFNRHHDASNKHHDTVSRSSVARTTSKMNDIPELPDAANTEAHGDMSEDPSSSVSFEEMMKTMETRDQEREMPNNLPGGVVLDQLYAIASSELNTLLFSQDATIFKSLADVQKTTELQIGPWKFENGGETLKRVMTSVKAATKLVKALKAIEEQTYLKADGRCFAVLSSVSTPDAPYGSCFRAEVLYSISQGPDLPSGEQSSQLVISWRMNFVQSTMMKGMIENGAKQGIKESFEQFATVLAQSANPTDAKNDSGKEQALASLDLEPQSDWKLAIQYLNNSTFIFTILVGLYVLIHLLGNGSTGLEIVGLDLPDSFCEVIVSGILVLQGERLLALVLRFIQARAHKGDHGITAEGEGCFLTVVLLEGNNLSAIRLSDPYVVFSCNGKTRSSSIKFQKSDPQWNEVFEFDAMNEPPSMLDADVYDFYGPFDESKSLGHAEINFVKSKISELSDVWVPVEGKLAQACQSKLHLRIFLTDTRGSNVVKDYLSKMEKEVGKKIKLRSPQTNLAFQKLFKLPAEEFLINDFTCQLKRKMPLQGRLFLSARIIGFHSDLFGRKTKFLFLWEDIETIHVYPPTFSSMVSPIIVMTLRLGRGLDAKHGAKTHDAQGRLKFHFQSFVSFNLAYRIIKALWKAKSLTPVQKVQIAQEEDGAKDLHIIEEEPASKSLQASEEDSDTKTHQSEENGSFFGLGDVGMSLFYYSVFPVPIKYVMELFSGNELEQKAMETSGCLNYTHSSWYSEKADVSVRTVYYRSKQISQYKGEVTSTQQKSRLSDKEGWVIEEVMTFHGIPLGDYFNVHLRYHIEDFASRSMGCNVQAYLGISWLKRTRQKNRFTKNIISNMQERLKVMFSVVEMEFASKK